MNCGLCRDCKWWNEEMKDSGVPHYADCDNSELKISCEEGCPLHQTEEDFGCVQFEAKTA